MLYVALAPSYPNFTGDIKKGIHNFIENLDIQKTVIPNITISYPIYTSTILQWATAVQCLTGCEPSKTNYRNCQQTFVVIIGTSSEAQIV